jgi:hypothetical protein
MFYPCHPFVELGSGCELPIRYTGNEVSGVVLQRLPLEGILQAYAEGF